MPALPASLAHAALAGAALAVLAACAREDEAALRARLDRWFSLGETVAFAAQGDCAAGRFRLVDGTIAAALPVAADVPGMLRLLSRRGAVALDDPARPPDAALVDLANADRATGMAMRRTGLEARACMDDAAQAAFRALLLSPGTLLAYDAQSGTLMLADRENRVLVAVMGAG